MNPLHAALAADFTQELRSALRSGARALQAVRRLERRRDYCVTSPESLQAHADLGVGLGAAAEVVRAWAGLLTIDDADLTRTERRAVDASLAWDLTCHEDPRVSPWKFSGR